jgi:dihydrofolate synthase/folylpolyglutamate synthase
VLERLFALETFGIKLGLTNITRLCEALDHPERRFTTVHIAGTNGKGSVTAMTHAGLMASGVRSARYTSPHLVHLAERFVIGNEPVAASALQETGNRVLDIADRLVSSGVLPAPPTFFEATTAIAFELFRRAGVEVAVIEVGLGGRFDATNVITPAVTAITSIGLDHQEQLGTTLASIAYEKAGIIKPGVPVVIGRLDPPAEDAVRGVALERGSPLTRAHDDVQADVRLEEGRAVLDVRTEMHRYAPMRLGLRGAHQADNALVALRTMERLRERGVPVTFDGIAAGLSTVAWPGRLELITRASAHGAGQAAARILLDAAHNPDGAAALARYLSRWHAERPPLVFAAMRDKDVDGMLRALLPVVGPLVLTAPSTHRALAPAALADAVRAIDASREVVVEPDPMRAIDRALEWRSTICVAGSIFLVGAVRDALGQRAILR